MSWLQAFILFASVLVAVGFMFAGTFLQLFFERWISALVQHRDGPGRSGRMEPFQVWTDFRKIYGKRFPGPRPEPSSLSMRLGMATWFALPVLFIVFLLSPLLPRRFAPLELPGLLVLPLVAAAIEAWFLFKAPDALERFNWRRHLLLRLFGASLLFLSVLAVVMRVGGSELAAVSELQLRFPFHAIFSSPGLLLCGLGAFFSIFLFSADGPAQSKAFPERSLGHSWQYFFFFVNRMWVFVLLCLWVYLFFGGAGGWIPRLLFPVKAAAAALAFAVLQVSFPSIRSADAVEISARWLLPLCLLGLLLETAWVGGLG